MSKSALDVVFTSSNVLSNAAGVIARALAFCVRAAMPVNLDGLTLLSTGNGRKGSASRGLNSARMSAAEEEKGFRRAEIRYRAFVARQIATKPSQWGGSLRNTHVAA